MADQKLELEVVLEDRQFKTASKNVTEKIKEIGDGIEAAGNKGRSGFSKLTGGVKAFAAAAKATVVLALVAGFVKLVKSSLQSAAAMEKQRIALSTMLQSGEKADKLLKNITKFAAATPFQLPGLIEASKRLIAFGVSSEDVIETMRNLGNAAGGDAEKLDRLTLAYGKVKSAGRASMEEIKQFTEAGVPILQALADKFGVTTEEVFKLSSTGKIGFKDLDAALKDLTTGSGKFAGMLEKQSRSLSGLFSTLKDQIGLIVLDFGQKLSPAFKNLIKSFMLGTKSGSLFADNLGIMASLTAKLVNTLALAVQGIIFLAINTQRAWVQFKKLKFLIENDLNPGFEKTIRLNHELQGEWDAIINKETELRQASKATTNMMSDTLEEIFSLQSDINKEKERSIEIEKKSQRVQSQNATDKGQKKPKKGKKDEFAEKKKRLQQYYDLDYKRKDEALQKERANQVLAAQDYENYLRTKFMMDSVYFMGLQTVASTAAVFMAEKNKKIFRFGQALAIAQTWINTFQGMMKAYAQLGVFGGAGAGVIFAAGVLQTRKIAAQKPPEFAVGSVNIPATQPAIVHKGETIINKPIAEGIRSGDLTLGGPGGGSQGPMVFQVDGKTFFEINEKHRDEAAQNMGSSGSFPVESPY